MRPSPLARAFRMRTVTLRPRARSFAFATWPAPGVPADWFGRRPWVRALPGSGLSACCRWHGGDLSWLVEFGDDKVPGLFWR